MLDRIESGQIRLAIYSDKILELELGRTQLQKLNRLDCQSLLRTIFWPYLWFMWISIVFIKISENGNHFRLALIFL